MRTPSRNQGASAEGESSTLAPRLKVAGIPHDISILAAPSDFEEMAACMLDIAYKAERGCYLEAPLCLFPLAVFTVDFDGEGGVYINEASLVSPVGRTFAKVLKAAAPGRVHVHGLPGATPAPVIPWPGGADC